MIFQAGVGGAGTRSPKSSAPFRTARLERVKIAAAWLLAALVCTAVTNAAEPSLFLVDGTFTGLWSRIFQVNATTGALSLRADLGSAYTPIVGMAAASARTLYLTGTDNGPSASCQSDLGCYLVKVVLDSSSTTPSLVQVIGPITYQGSMVAGFTGLTFRRDGRLYGSSQTTSGLYVIDPDTAQATLVGIIDVEIHGGDITFDAEDRLWIWTNLGAGSGIYQLNPDTAHASAFDLHPGLDLAGFAAIGHTDDMRGASASTNRLYDANSVVGFTGTNRLLTYNGSVFDHMRGDMDSPYCEGDEACADENACTSDSCGPGGCQHPPAENGISCDDSNACTQTDSCQDGSCSGGNPVICLAPDTCHDPGTCDPASGNCENAPVKPDGTSCDDGNACTTQDGCASGTCIGGSPLLCPAIDACHEASVCNPASGVCEPGPIKPDGTPCNDGNACTQTDSCQAGACTGTSPLVCSAPDACHDAGTCNPASGACENAPSKPDGTSCNDGNACTQTDSCQAGACTGTSPLLCSAPDACHDAGTCNPASGACENAPSKPDGTSCNDGNACTQTDSCQAGACTGTSPVVCAAPDACHDAGTCNPASGACENPPVKADGTLCSDGNTCTQSDSCQAGTCTGASPVVCTAPDACHDAGTCNPASGACENAPSKPDGTSCNDGNACTQTDSCQAGACTGTSPVVCAAPDACHDAGTCNPASGACENPPVKADGTLCNDGNTCTQSDSCQAGTCTGASPVVCTAPDACHDAGTCNPASGACENPPVKADGTLCNDGNSCTQGDSCLSGSCQSGPPTDMDGDGHPDVFCGGDDCQDTNPMVWYPPFEVANFRADGTNNSDFAWDRQDVQAGPATQFQLSSGNFGTTGFSLATGSCLEDSVNANTYSDARPAPALGNGYWYLVRATNSCGVGTLGTTQRDNLVAPCP